MFQSRFTAIVFSSLICFASSSFAGMFLEKISHHMPLTKINTAKVKLKYDTPASSDLFPAFTGTWEGNCDGHLDTFKIKSNRNYFIVFDVDEEFALTARINQNETNVTAESTIFMKMNWSKDNKSLIVTLVDVSSDSTDQSVSTFISESSLSINDNDDLVVTEDYKEFVGTKETLVEPQAQCIYKRVK